MAEQKITETPVAGQLEKEAFVVVTQQEDDGDGISVESLRRVPVDVLLGDIRQEIADLKYVPISITSFGITGSELASGIKAGATTMELGAVVDALTFAWSLNKTAETVTLDGEAVEPGETGIVKSGLGIRENRKFWLTATDERNAVSQKSVTVSFVNGIYYGAMAAGGYVDSDVLLGMVRKLQGSRGATFTVDAAGKRPVFACPSRYGTPTFVIGGFTYEWSKAATIDFCNASGYTERYDVWMHGQDVAGSITVTVS